MSNAVKYDLLKSALFSQGNVIIYVWQHQKEIPLKTGNDIKSRDKNGYILSTWKEVNKLLTRPSMLDWNSEASVIEMPVRRV